MLTTASRIAGFAVCLTACSPSGHPGAIVYTDHCAGCHEPAVETRAPERAALQRLAPEAILRSLEEGSMMRAGALISAGQRRAVAEYLGGRALDTSLYLGRAPGAGVSARCVASRPPIDAKYPDWSGWGADARNTRAQSAKAAGLSREDVRRLRLRWAFGFEGTNFAYSQPAVAGGVVYVGSATGTIYALDAREGCVLWTFVAETSVRTAMSVGRGSAPDTQPRVYFGDLQGTAYALDARSGRLAWKVRVDSHPHARITGAPLLHGGRLFVPVSSAEEMAAANPGYPCCTFRGSVVALEAATGRRLWKTYTIPDAPEKTGFNSAGTQTWGPSGGATWSTPTADDARGLLYVTTGNAYTRKGSVPRTINAVLAFDQLTGSLRWSWQATPDDIYNISCHTPSKANCVDDEGPDFDFGASAVLQDVGGRRLLIAAQKSGDVHALDADTDGRRVWHNNLGADSVLASVVFGPAVAEGKAFVPYALQARQPNPLTPDGGVAAVDLATGRIVWRHETKGPSTCPSAGKCSGAHVAAVTWIPGVVFSGALDGRLRAFDSRTGDLFWEFDTARPFATVNGVSARGGSINGPGPVVADGMVYVNSGFLAIGMGGNVLLAFSPEQ